MKNPAAVELGRLGGLKGGPARRDSLSPERRSEISRDAVTVRWNGRPEIHQVVRKMLNDIATDEKPKVLYVQGKTAWYAEPGHLEEPRWADYCVGTYGDGATFTSVMEDVVTEP